MNIPDFVLNWIIFRPDSMKKWIFKTDRPRESSAGCSALNGPTYATYTTDTCTPPQLLHLFYDWKAQIFKGRLAQVGAGAITAAEVEMSELWWVERRIEVPAKWFHLLLSHCFPPIWWRRQSRRQEMDLFLSRFQCCCADQTEIDPNHRVAGLGQ